MGLKFKAICGEPQKFARYKAGHFGVVPPTNFNLRSIDQSGQPRDKPEGTLKVWRQTGLIMKIYKVKYISHLNLDHCDLWRPTQNPQHLVFSPRWRACVSRVQPSLLLFLWRGCFRFFLIASWLPGPRDQRWKQFKHSQQLYSNRFDDIWVCLKIAKHQHFGVLSSCYLVKLQF